MVSIIEKVEIMKKRSWMKKLAMAAAMILLLSNVGTSVYAVSAAETEVPAPIEKEAEEPASAEDQVI